MSNNNPLLSGAGAFLRGVMHKGGSYLGDSLFSLKKTINKAEDDMNVRLVEMGLAEWRTVNNRPVLNFLDDKIKYVFTGETTEEIEEILKEG